MLGHFNKTISLLWTAHAVQKADSKWQVLQINLKGQFAPKSTILTFPYL